MFGNLNQYLPTGLPLNLFVLVASNTKKMCTFFEALQCGVNSNQFFLPTETQEAVTRGFSVKKVLVKISQDSKESTCGARVSFLK